MAKALKGQCTFSPLPLGGVPRGHLQQAAILQAAQTAAAARQPQPPSTGQRPRRGHKQGQVTGVQVRFLPAIISEAGCPGAVGVLRCSPFCPPVGAQRREWA